MAIFAREPPPRTRERPADPVVRAGARVGETPHPAVPALNVAFVVLPEFTLLAFTGFVEALRHAADEGDDSRPIHCRWTVVGPTLSPVRASCGVEITPWERFGDPSVYDYIIVVGGLLRAHPRIDPAIYTYLRAASEHGVPLIGLCTGTFVLARAGLLKGRRCCVHWFHLQHFEHEFPELTVVANELFVTDRGRITCAGGAGAVDVAVHLIERHCGRARALKSLRQMVVETARDHDAPQPRAGLTGVPDVADPLVRRAVQLMEQRLGEPLSILSLSRQLRVSVRQLERAFRACLGSSPATFCRRLRLDHGRWLVTATRRSMTEIALECGFADASHFGRCFRRTFGQSPAQARIAASVLRQRGPASLSRDGAVEAAAGG
jgi:transcriptional regulator GlxA family with amidase domain